MLSFPNNVISDSMLWIVMSDGFNVVYITLLFLNCFIRDLDW